MLTPLTALLVAICSIWLIAGLIDYACHRRTHIESTSGTAESLLHLAQFVVLGFALVLAIGVTVTPFSFALVSLGAVVHSILAFIDVAYTDQRRRIAPLEQHVHGYLDVLPLAAAGVFGVQHWDRVSETSTPMEWTPMEWTIGDNRYAVLGIGVYILVVGTPIVEELLRTMRYAKSSGSDPLEAATER